MANDNKEIGEIVKKCKILLLDIEGTTTSISFVKDKLFPYAEENVKQFLDSQWETEDVKGAVEALRKLALEDQEKSVEGVVAIPGEDASKEDQIEGLVKNVKWQMSSDRKVGPLKQLQGLIWKQGYDSGDIKGHVYDDVSPAMEQWRSVDGQKVYIYSSGSVDAQKLLFGQSQAGDLLPLIDGHFDTAVGAKQEAASYAAIAEKIGCKADEILFLTDIVKEAEAAKESGVNVALVSREGNAPLPAAADFPVLHSLEQLSPTNKRKPEDTQDELPAKVAKTDVVDDVKATNVEAESKVAETEPEPVTEDQPKKEDKPETMEVEEPVTEKQTNNDTIVDVAMEVKEVTDLKDLENIPEIEAEPIIIEEKTDIEKETEPMETEPIPPAEVQSSKTNGIDEIKNGNVTEAVPEKLPTVITEIEDITEKQDLAEVGEIIEDLKPVIEEPVVEDMEDLQNVGEVLDKECDEILSKVQDVTNLDNIPIKPLLNPIAEETMETENLDSNDIVDRILDTELELEMKQCSDIDLNTVQEITDLKSDTVNEKVHKVEDDNNEKLKEVPVVDEKTTDAVGENVTDGNVVSSPTETKAEENTTENTVPETKEESKVEERMVTVNKEVKEPEPESKDEPVEKTTTPAAEESVDIKENEKVPDVKEADIKDTDEPKESKMNGKTTNGDAEVVNVNGNASKTEELNSRLSVAENGKKAVNGANGDAEKAPGEKAEPELTDIKVKSVTDVAGDEPRPDPIEQPTEA